MTRPSRLLTVLRAVVTALLVLSGSIAVPILCRFFYYLHIGPLGLVEQTGLSADQIRQAYNEMMDFCIGTPVYWLLGFGLMFAGGGALIRFLTGEELPVVRALRQAAEQWGSGR